MIKLSNRFILQSAIVGFLAPSFGWVYYTYFNDYKFSPKEYKNDRAIKAKKDLNLVEKKLSALAEESNSLLKRKNALLDLIESLSRTDGAYASLIEFPLFDELSDTTKFFLKSIEEKKGKSFITLKKSNHSTMLKLDADLFVVKNGNRHYIPFAESDIIVEALAVMARDREVNRIQITYNEKHADKIPRLQKYIFDLSIRTKEPFSLTETKDSDDISVIFTYSDKERKI